MDKQTNTAPAMNNGQTEPRIGRLDPLIRDWINRSLLDEKLLPFIVQALNATPDILAPLADGTGPPQLTEADLQEWRQHAFPKWLEQQQVLSDLVAMSEDVDAASRMLAKPLSGQLAAWAATQYVLQSRRLRQNSADPEKTWKQLREFSNDVALLRRGDQRAEWLSLERDKLALAERDHLMKYKKKLTLGLEAFQAKVRGNPKAAKAYAALAREMQGPFDDLPGGMEDAAAEAGTAPNGFEAVPDGDQWTNGDPAAGDSLESEHDTVDEADAGTLEDGNQTGDGTNGDTVNGGQPAGDESNGTPAESGVHAASVSDQTDAAEPIPGLVEPGTLEQAEANAPAPPDTPNDGQQTSAATAAPESEAERPVQAASAPDQTGAADPIPGLVEPGTLNPAEACAPASPDTLKDGTPTSAPPPEVLEEVFQYDPNSSHSCDRQKRDWLRAQEKKRQAAAANRDEFEFDPTLSSPIWAQVQAWKVAQAMKRRAQRSRA